MTLVEELAMQDQIYQIITLCLVIFGIGLEIKQWINAPIEKYWIISTLTWLFHTVFFYTFLLLDRYTVIDMHPLFGTYTLWSSVLRLHIIASVLILEWYRIHQWKLRLMKATLTVQLGISKELETARKLTLENKQLIQGLHDILENERTDKNE